MHQSKPVACLIGRFKDGGAGKVMIWMGCGGCRVSLGKTVTRRRNMTLCNVDVCSAMGSLFGMGVRTDSRL